MRDQSVQQYNTPLPPPQVIRAPDGALQKAALTQQALAKERRELREQQRNQLLDSIPKDLGPAPARSGPNPPPNVQQPPAGGQR